MSCKAIKASRDETVLTPAAAEARATSDGPPETSGAKLAPPVDGRDARGPLAELAPPGPVTFISELPMPRG